MTLDVDIRWASYGPYSGPVIRSSIPLPVPTETSPHLDRAYWLTTKVETGGTIGTVFIADGTCVTAGPDQHIGVYPKELANEDWYAEDDQGTVWKLLRRLELVSGSDSFHLALDALFDEMKKFGLYVAQDGVVRYLADCEVMVRGRKKLVIAGSFAHGNYIRESFTPPGGAVPRTGPEWDRAARWAMLWHRLTAHPDAHRPQIEYGHEHLIKRTERRTITADGRKRTIERALYGERSISGAKLVPELDLAACVFHSHSVNGPAPAMRALQDSVNAISPQDKPVEFARNLIARLGNHAYGRWDDDIDHGRYQRTRSHARASGLWHRTLFDGSGAIMPKDLPG